MTTIPMVAAVDRPPLPLPSSVVVTKTNEGISGKGVFLYRIKLPCLASATLDEFYKRFSLFAVLISSNMAAFVLSFESIGSGRTEWQKKVRVCGNHP